MDPLAYDLREHEIFESPFKIDRSKMISIPTPEDFREEIQGAKIRVLPLVDNPAAKWKAGWCSYAYDFTRNPDVEFFSGGVNHKTPTAAGLWRQGNLLHFGFEQSPSEMNQQGRRLLLNSIAYIRRFSEDRPIAITPSVFAGPIARPRDYAGRALRSPDYKTAWLTNIIAPGLWIKLTPLSREKIVQWFDENERYLHPNGDGRVVPLGSIKSMIQLEVDEDLAALGVPFDKPEFFDKTLAALGAGGGAEERARRLLDRYAAIGPKNGTAEQWAAWWQENRPYAFASDSSDYRWYINPLAKQRGIPTGELRGPRRADAPQNRAVQ